MKKLGVEDKPVDFAETDFPNTRAATGD